MLSQNTLKSLPPLQKLTTTLPSSSPRKKFFKVSEVSESLNQSLKVSSKLLFTTVFRTGNAFQISRSSSRISKDRWIIKLHLCGSSSLHIFYYILLYTIITIKNMRFFVPCQINVVNKQFFSSLNWNNPLPKTTLGESYIIMIDRHLDVKKKHSLDVEVCVLSPLLFHQRGCLTANFGPLSRGPAIPQGTFVSMLKICYIFLNKKKNLVKLHSLIPHKRNLPFMRYLFIGYQPGKWSANFLYWH